MTQRETGYKCGHHGTPLERFDRPKPDHYGDSLDTYGACRHCFPDLFDADTLEGQR